MSVRIRGIRPLAPISPDGYGHADWNWRLINAPALEFSERGWTKTEASRAYKWKYSWKSSQSKTRKILSLMPIMFSKALISRTCLVQKYSYLDDQAVKLATTLVSRLPAEMKVHISDPIEPISIISFLHTFMMARHKKGITDGVIMWLFLFFIRESEPDSLARHLLVNVKGLNYSLNKALNTYFHVVSHPLNTYAIQNLVAKTGTISLAFKPSNRSPIENVNALWVERLHGSHMCDEFLVKGILIKGLLQFLNDYYIKRTFSMLPQCRS